MRIDPTSSYSAAALSGPRLTFFGGKTLKHPSFVSLYAGNYWSSLRGSKDRATLNRCSESVPTGAYTSIWREYGVSKGSFAGSTSVSLGTSKRRIAEDDIQRIVANAIAKGGSPKDAVKQPDGKTVYTVFLPPGVTLVADNVDSRHGLGGFHGSYVDDASGRRVYYAALAYADKNNGIHFTDSPVDNISIAASHEWSEAVTDPDVNAGRLGWYDTNFGEIGDIPVSMGNRLSDLWGRIDGCAVQKEWSNGARRPVLSE
jgi:hypothetical protein